MEPLSLSDVFYTAYTFRSARDTYALMLVVDGFTESSEAKEYLDRLVPLLMAEPSSTVH